MKDFMKFTLATICGIVILTIVGGLLFALTIMGMLSGSSPTVKAKENSVFVLKLNGLISERYEDPGPVAALLGQVDMDGMGLDDILTAIKRARDEENIKGIYLEGGVTSFDSPATAQQIRDALQDFRQSGKWIIAFADQYLQAAYYVSSVADSVYLNQTGLIDFKGLGGKNFYMKGLYDKVGVRYEATRVGRYKSYVETQTRTGMSDDDRMQRQAYLGSIWNHWLASMAQSRGTSADSLWQLADSGIVAFAAPQDYVAAHLVDGLMYPDEVKQVVRRQLGMASDDEEINQLTLNDMLNLKQKKTRQRGDRIAVYYAYGEIVDQMASGFASEHAIVGGKTVDDLRSLADDERVKAVVLRVNSGGGSAVASEQIWHAVKQLNEKKPVVVSMGGVAASGGYMMSCAATRILAEPTTITGSIGIFGLVPNLSGLVTGKLGVTLDGVGTNAYTSYETDLVFGRDNSRELQFMQGYVERGYDKFLDIVAEGRHLSRDSVHQVAQGRVWVATDALDHGLVDQLGSLDDAIALAAQLAQSEQYYTASYPQKTDWLDALLGSDDGQKISYLDGQMHQLLGELYEPYMQMRRDQQRNRLQARLPFSVRME